MFDFSAAPLTFLLLIANVLLSGYALLGDNSLFERLAFRPTKVLRAKEYHRLLTAGFIHVGLGHLAFNMITLYFFGPLLEQILGPFRFLLLYFGSELAAHGLSLWFNRNRDGYSAVGASGAISGVVFAFCLFYPFEQICLFFALCLPAWLFAIVYLAGSVYAMRQSQAQGALGGIAHEAHLGGALGGLLLTVLLEPAVLSRFLGYFGL